MHHNQSVNSCRDIVEHDPGPLWKRFQLTHRRRLDNVKRSEKYKSGQESFPAERGGYERDELSGDFVDDDHLWIFVANGARDTRRGRNSDQGYKRSQRNNQRCVQAGMSEVRDDGPE